MIRILFFTLFFLNLLFSSVTLKSSSSFVMGEPFVFELVYEGSKEPIFPNITNIDNFTVQKVGKSSQISIINNHKTQTISQKYLLYASKSFVLPVFEIKTGSITYKTKEKQIKAKEVNKTNSKDFDLDISIDKNNLYEREQLLLNIKFKHKIELDLLGMELSQANFEGFWVKSLGKTTKEQKDGFMIYSLNYILFPQRSGHIKIEPLSINVRLAEKNNGYGFFTTSTKTKKIYSNSLEVDVKQLPDNLNLVGEFHINSSINKTKVKFGEAVSFKLDIVAKGNIDDLEDIKLNIPNATIYENKPIKKYNFEDNQYGGTYFKSFSIVADSSFIIKPIKIEYFDIKTKTKRIIQTKEYKVEVLAPKQRKEEVVLQKEDSKQNNKPQKIIVQKLPSEQKIFYFILGFACSSLLVFILYYLKKEKKVKKQDESSILKRVKTSKSKDELLKILSPYVNNYDRLDSVIYKLEEIEQNEFKNIKKDILKELKTLDIR